VCALLAAAVVAVIAVVRVGAACGLLVEHVAGAAVATV
jgi:hypothetical protein